MTATDEELRNQFAQLIDHDRREGISPESTADAVIAFAKLGRARVLAVSAERDHLRAQLDALIAVCDAEYAPPASEQPTGIPALLDALADQMPALSPEEELDGWKRQSAWSHHMATRFNRKVWDLRAKVTWLAASHSDGLDLIIQLSDERDRLQEQLTAAGLLPVPQPPGAQVLECSATLFRTFAGAGGHHSHTWAPQSGVTPVWCPGNTAPKETTDARRR